MNTNHIAEFPKAEQAQAFFARLQEGGWYVKDVSIKGRKVTFTDDLPADYLDRPGNDKFTHFQDMLESVGYYGSGQNRKAKLDGVPAPMSY